MALKLTNNAISRLAGNISNTDTTINLVPGDGALFPALSAGDWFPATIVKSTGESEVVQCTARSVDTLTVVRGQETTFARAFNAGDRIELRMTAGSFDGIFAQIAAKFDKSGGAISGNLTVTGSVSADTIAADSNMTAGGNAVWHAGNFDPATKANKAGETFTGAVEIAAGAATLLKLNTSAETVNQMEIYSQNTLRSRLGANASYPFFLTNASAGNIISADNSGNFTAVGNVTAYSDARLKTDLERISGALAAIERLTGYRYTRTDTGERHLGLIAQAVQQVCPEAVREDENGMLSVAYGNLVALAFEGIKELAEEVRALKGRR